MEARLSERGQVLPVMGAALVMIIGSAALAVDVGFWSDEQRKQQAATDSAAIAGAAERAYPIGTASPYGYVTAARNDASSDGYTHDGTNIIVTVNNPPSSGNYTGDLSAVEVLLKAKHPSFFAGIFGHTQDWITTRAVSRQVSTGGACVVALSPNYSPYTMWTTGGNINASSCSIIDNGTWEFTGGNVTVQSIGVVGSVTYTGGTYGLATPQPSLPASDPCSMISACEYLVANPPAATPCVPSSDDSVSGGTVTLPPGNYCSGLKISGGNVTLQPGLYNITNDELKVSGGIVSGAGVTFYVGDDSDINLTGGTVNFTAPTTGNYNGLLFYQPKSNTTTAQLTGGGGASCPSATPVFTGMFYAPGALLDVTGGGSWDPSAIVVNALETTGGSLTCMTMPVGGLPTHHAAMAE